MNPFTISVCAAGASRLGRSSLWRTISARAALVGAALVLAASTAAAAPSPGDARLQALETQVRQGDADALARLLQAGGAYGSQAPYADQAAYLQLLAQAYRDAGQLDAAYAADARLARLAEAHGDLATAAIGALGRVGAQLGKDPAAALETLAALDARYADVGDPQFIATVQQLYGDLYAALGQFDFALGHYLKALEVARAHPNLLSPTVAGLYLSLARVHIYNHAPDKVLAALPGPGLEGAGLPPRSRVRVFLYKGIAEVMRGHPAQAREAYAQALALARAHDFPMLQAAVLGDIADSYLHEHAYVEAERAARAAIPVALRSASPDVIRAATVNLGFALAGQGRMAEGLKVIDDVVKQMREAGAWPDLADVLLDQSRTLERAGRYREALAVQREHEAIVARLVSSEHEKTMAVLQEQFSAQQRAIQIEGLRRANAVKDRELQRRRVWQLIASGGAALALLLCGFVYHLYRRSRRTQRRLEELNAELEFHSTHDALTGLLNRRSFRERMLAGAGAGAGADAARPAECFILLDLDHFKAINDSYGHGAGDEVLVEAARRLRAAVGERGLVMRWGGEEFLVHVASVERGAHAALVRALLDALAGAPVLIASGAALRVTATAGALSLPARAGGEPGVRDWQNAVARADHALYKGKLDGRNRAYLIDGATADACGAQLVLPTARTLAA